MKRYISTALLMSGLLPAFAAEKPNIIVILVDDMGFSDLGCFGSEIQTPNLDRLAANGLRFTQFYNSARSCPTRASLLTGLDPHQAGIGQMAGNSNSSFENDAYVGNLNSRCVTLAEVMKPAGYFTAMAGKWHVGSTGPKLRGFDRSYEQMGFYYLNDNDGAHKVNIDGVATANGGDADPANWYSSYKWAEWGNKYINEGIAQQKPFFLYLAFNAPHFPIAAPDSVVNKYIGKYSAGWSELRKTRYARQKELGLIDDKFVLTPDDDVWTKWSDLTTKQKAQQDSIMATYAACVDIMDQSIGRVIDNLKAKGVFDNTLIVFMSDNGGNAEGPSTGLGNNTGTGYIGSAMSNIHCGGTWANAQNTPFKEYKHYIHEGGIHTSFIAHWPNGISAKGEFRSQTAHVMDIMPTIVEVSGASYPTVFNGKAITPMQGTSLVPAFDNQSLNRDTICWEHEANRGIRIKDMKCVAKVNKIRVFTQADHNRWELYNLATDPTEMVNLATSQPELLKSMIADWERLAGIKKILPWPWGDYYNNTKTGLTPFFRETFGEEGPAINSFPPAINGTKTADYTDYNVAGTEYVSSNVAKIAIVSPEVASDINGASGGSALMFGAASASEKLIIKSINTSEYDSVTLSYNVYKGTGTTSNLSVRVSSNDGLTWTPLTKSGSVTPTEKWKNIILPEFLPSVQSLWVELGISSQYTLFDDIILSGVEKTDTHIPVHLGSTITVYPNPAKNTIFVTGNPLDIKQLSVIGLDGKMIKTIHAVNNIDVSSLSRGLFLLKIVTNLGEIRYKQFIKN